MQPSHKTVFFEKHVLLVDENVYEPAEDSFLFAENLQVDEDDVILDMGTGCGILGIGASEKAKHVVATDSNPFAVCCAKKNAKLNQVQNKLSFVVGDLFSSIKEWKGFDLIIFNAPYLPTENTEEDSWLARAWTGGTTGRQIIDRFIIDAPKYLKQTGRILLMQSTLSDIEQTLKLFKKDELKASIVAKHDLPFFETIVLIKAEH